TPTSAPSDLNDGPTSRLNRCFRFNGTDQGLAVGNAVGVANGSGMQAGRETTVAVGGTPSSVFSKGLALAYVDGNRVALCCGWGGAGGAPMAAWLINADTGAAYPAGSPALISKAALATGMSGSVDVVGDACWIPPTTPHGAGTV